MSVRKYLAPILLLLFLLACTEEEDSSPMSSDKSADAMKEYMEWGEMNFPAVKYAERGEVGLEALAARGIPYLVVMDAEGNQLLGEDEGETWKAPQTVLAELKNLLKSKG